MLGNTLFISVIQDDVEAQQEFDDFFEEVFCDLEDKVRSLSMTFNKLRIGCICLYRRGLANMLFNVSSIVSWTKSILAFLPFRNITFLLQ